MSQETSNFSALGRTPRGESGAMRWPELPVFPTEAFEAGGEHNAMRLLVWDPASSLATTVTRHNARSPMESLMRRVDMAIGQQARVVEIHGRGVGQRGRIAEGWRKPTKRAVREVFVREREYVGHVRDIDQLHGTFSAVLTSRVDDPEAELVATFSFRLLGGKQAEQLSTGDVFRLVTGYRHTVDDSGRVVRAASESRIFMQAPRALSPARREQARELADRLLESD